MRIKILGSQIVAIALAAIGLFLSACGDIREKETSRPASDGEGHTADGVRIGKYPLLAKQSWFPLIPASRYVYEGRFQDKVHEQILTVVKESTPYGDLCYFAHPTDVGKEPSPSLDSNMFGRAGYVTTAGELLTIRASFFGGFTEEKSSRAYSMLRFPPKTGDKTVINDGFSILTTTVQGFEKIEVPAGRFPACCRLQIVQQFPEGSETGSVWIAEGVGVVKWRRSTGRIDQLLKFEQITDGQQGNAKDR